MRLSELIDKLEEIRDEWGDGYDPEVLLAQQPHYPLQHRVGDVVAVDLNAPDEDERESDDDELADEDVEPNVVVYIGEGSAPRSSPYLPGAASRELGWRR